MTAEFHEVNCEFSMEFPSDNMAAILESSLLNKRCATGSGHPHPGEGQVTTLYHCWSIDVGKVNPSASYVNAGRDQGSPLGHSGLPPSPSTIRSKRRP